MALSGERGLPRGAMVVLIFTAGVALFIAFFFFFGGWNASKPADLILSNGDEPQSLDPAIVTGQLEGRLCLALFEGLTTRAANGDIVPGLAESWEKSPDGITYTFHLRPGLKWSNSEPLTAQDFVGSWERTLRPETASEYAYQLYYVKNAQPYAEGKLKDFSQVGVKAPDDRTLVVTLEHPTAFFLELCSFQTLVPMHLPTIAKWGKEWIKPGHMVSNGPYMLKEWRLNDYIMVEANPYYWRPVPVKRVKVLPTSNSTSTFNEFYSGKSDLVLDTRSIPSTLIPDIKDAPYFHSTPFGATSFIRFNVKRKPFDDPRVRKALALALNKEDVVTKVTRAGEPVANHLTPPGYAGYTAPKGLEYNPDEARRLLAEAGYPGGKGFPDVNLLYANRGATGVQVVTEMQALWKKELGIDSIHLQGQEWKVYLNTMSLMDYDFGLGAWIGDYNDPQTFIDMFVTNGGNNQTGWSNAKYDAMLAQSENTADPAARMAIMHDMEKLLVEDEVPIVPVYFWVGAALYYPDKVGGFEPNFVDDHRWGNFFIPEKKP